MTALAPIDPARTALLIMDYQLGILSRVDADALLDKARQLLDAARTAGIFVGYVRVALTAEEAAAVPASNRIFAQFAAPGPVSIDDPSRALDPRLGAREDEPVFRKVRVGAFSTTQLGSTLEDRGIDTLLLAGISTSGVVLSTVRDAADHDYRIVVIADACADPDPEVHRVLTEKVFPRQGEVVETAELVAAL